MQAASTDVALRSIGAYHTPLNTEVDALTLPTALALVVLRSIVAIVARRSGVHSLNTVPSEARGVAHALFISRALHTVAEVPPGANTTGANIVDCAVITIVT